jgi:hypothetical protein
MAVARLREIRWPSRTKGDRRRCAPNASWLSQAATQQIRARGKHRQRHARSCLTGSRRLDMTGRLVGVRPRWPLPVRRWTPRRRDTSPSAPGRANVRAGRRAPSVRNNLMSVLRLADAQHVRCALRLMAGPTSASLPVAFAQTQPGGTAAGATAFAFQRPTSCELFGDASITLATGHGSIGMPRLGSPTRASRGGHDAADVDGLCVRRTATLRVVGSSLLSARSARHHATRSLSFRRRSRHLLGAVRAAPGVCAASAGVNRSRSPWLSPPLASVSG